MEPLIQKATTSSDPVSSGTPAGVPDVDSAYRVATDSIAALLQPNKRHGAEMDAAGAPATAVFTPTVCDLGASSLDDGMDLEETQAAVVDNCSKRMKEDDITRELMEAAANKAVENVMLTLQSQLQAQQQFLLDNMNGSVEKAVNNAVTSLTSDLHSRMQAPEVQVGAQIDSRTRNHWEAF